MKLGTKGRYAVMAMADLALKGEQEIVSLSDIAASQELPLEYLEQIFSLLRRKGVVESVRGQRGGYRLTRVPQDIFISDIVLAVGEELRATRCNRDTLTGCQGKKGRCLTHDLWDGLDHQILSYLRSISLKDLCERNLPHLRAL